MFPEQDFAIKFSE